jgi:predicted AlkP superfamily phosphohydrolase/phosphomutase
MLAGMGVPDLRGGLGTPTFFSTAADVTAGESENVEPLRPATGAGRFTARLPGPRSPKDRAPVHVDLTFCLDAIDDTLRILAPGEPALRARLGEWSDWLRVRFRVGVLQSISGLVRFHVVRLRPELEVYATPVNFDPEAPLFPLSAPPDFARELAGAVGTFYTTGMVEDHTGLNNGRIDEWAFLDQCEEVWNEREAMMLHELEWLDEGLLYCLFDTPDRVQHMFWRFRDPGHPSLGGAAAPVEFAHAIEDQYRRADEVVGKVLAWADDRTLVIALSDHGFGPFRRGFHLNTWLHDHGLLTLRDGRKPGDPDIEPFPNSIDWARTRAFAVGLGGIYLNLEGRESQGTVRPDEVECLTAEIARELTGLPDPKTGTIAVRAVKSRAQLYRGPFADESPDLVVHLADGYRVSWSSSLGGVVQGLFEDNRKKWSGDHIVDPALVPGVLFMNRPFCRDGACLVDLAPTILDTLGLAPGPNMEGRTLFR